MRSILSRLSYRYFVTLSRRVIKTVVSGFKYKYDGEWGFEASSEVVTKDLCGWKLTGIVGGKRKSKNGMIHRVFINNTCLTPILTPFTSTGSLVCGFIVRLLLDTLVCTLVAAVFKCDFHALSVVDECRTWSRSVDVRPLLRGSPAVDRLAC